ncbi:ATP-binding protein [Aquincola tertiaricarbonis]|uniref:histidine kinase n=1 Tax=Aquincola tertiaricarbonis TaxID=391953 RepID=A0ABY4S3G9_AQUTE|nr:ATP-binding protein [Aquincola tertiaricarbonis]URI07564.1 ATP-binding protein [Aquincola tertiaricarbonis]
MNQPPLPALASLPLGSPAEVVAARQQVRRVAELLGLDRKGQTRLATAVSEIARNAFSHAGGGQVLIGLAGRQLQVLVRDQGRGIADLDQILSGQKVFAPGQGAGLASARRLVDELDIQTSPQGTEVRLAQWLPADPSAAQLQALTAALPPRRADPVAELQAQDRELITSLADLQEREAEADRLNRELEDTNRGVVALYSELEQKAEELRGASEMKSRFLSHMSHEFRTPLNSIMALTRLLIDGVDGPLTTEQNRQVEYIRRSAQTLLELVNDLLDLAKVEAGRLDVRPSEFTVTDLFASLRGLLKPLLTNPAVNLVFDAAPDLPVLLADEQKLAQVLRNLVSNALKFTEAGHVQVRARHDARRARLVFEVEDTGIGIAASSIDLIFEEFAQVEGRLQRGGTGLGLPLSRRLAMLLGGELTARSEPGAGSTFTLTMPVRFGQAALPEDEGTEGRARRRVLVVDDEEVFRYVIRHISQDAGFEVLEADNGETGLALALAEAPDMIFLDLHMPRLDGFGVLAQLAASPLHATPVVVCTSHALTVDQKRALAAAYAIVPKQDLSRDGLSRLMNLVLAPGDDGR